MRLQPVVHGVKGWCEGAVLEGWCEAAAPGRVAAHGQRVLNRLSRFLAVGAPLPQLLQRRLGHCGESDSYWMGRAVEGGAGELAGGRRVTGEHDELDLAVRAEVIEDLG